jgi:hypothetical protein
MDSQSKLQLLNRGYELVLNGGSVWDKNVPLDPNLNRNTGGFGELITKIFKESKIKFNVKEASNTFSENLKYITFVEICFVLSLIDYHLLFF